MSGGRESSGAHWSFAPRITAATNPTRIHARQMTGGAHRNTFACPRRRRPCRASAFRRRPARRPADRHPATPQPRPAPKPGRLRGSTSRQRRITRSTRGSMSLAREVTAVGVVRCGAIFEGPLAGEHLVQHQPQRVNIAAHRNFLAGQLLGRHVGGRAVAEMSLRPVVRPAPPGRSR